MPSTTRKPQAKRQERRARIEQALLAATDRLMREGTSFTELSVDRLATEAGISRASFYIYFEDKGHLLRRLAEQAFSDLTANAQRWWGAGPQLVAGDVHAAVEAVIASYRRHQPVLVALNEMAAYDPLAARIYRDMLNGPIERLTQVILDGQADGSIRRELPAATTASALTWMTERICQQSLPSAPTSFDAELANTLAQIIWGALYLKEFPTD